MMQDSLARALGTLKGARMDDVAADNVRKRLEQAWAGRAAHRRPRFVVPGFARTTRREIVPYAIVPGSSPGGVLFGKPVPALGSSPN